jgi:pterin-4a-carbinolamine dehydratase
MSTESLNPQHPQSQPGGPETAPAPAAPEPESLKAERVQIRVNAGPQPLKAERVQEELKSMPGWRLDRGSRSVSRVRHFPDAATAASYAGHLTQLAVQEGHPLSIELDSTRVAMTLRSRYYRGVFLGITRECLEFARSLT